MTYTVRQLAEILGAELEGDASMIIHRILPIEDATEGDITFVSNKKYEKYLADTNATAVIISHETTFHREGLALLRVPDPYIGFATALALFHPPRRYAAAGIHATAVVDASATLGDNVTIAAGAVIGQNVCIGRASIIAEGCVIRDNVVIGEDCLIYPNVTILDHCTVGDRVIIHSGSTIGSDGFGFAPTSTMYKKIPQVGSVCIGNDVEIGANCTIDRGTLGTTTIHSGVKLDNLIQIAHNVEIGENTVIAAQSGISGSTVLGKRVLVAGQVGMVGHIEIGDNVTIGAQAGVAKSLHGEGKVFRGSPAREIHEELRLEAATRHLPELIKTVRNLEHRIVELENLLIRRQEQN